jgi:hypothetical protein
MFRGSVSCGLANSRGRPKQKVKQDRQCKCKRNIESRLCDHCCREKAIGITYSECVLFLVIRPAKRMRYIKLSSVAYLAVPNFSACLIKATIFRKKILIIKCVIWFFLQILSEVFLVVSRNHRDIVINLRRSLCKVPVILVRF